MKLMNNPLLKEHFPNAKFIESENIDIEDDEISAKVSTVTGKNMAKITLKLDAADPPEGIARIRQELIKILPS